MQTREIPVACCSLLFTGRRSQSSSGQQLGDDSAAGSNVVSRSLALVLLVSSELDSEGKH